MIYKLECKICNAIVQSEHESIIFNLLSKHINNHHKEITTEEYYIKYGETGHKLNICPSCGKQTKFHNLRIGYAKHCCSKCSANDPNVRLEIEKTSVTKYGGIGFQSIDLANKTKKTIFEKYGTTKIKDIPQVNEKIKKTMLDRYGVEHNFNGKYGERQCDKTIISKYGDTYQQEKHKKYKSTCIEKYGIDNFFKTEEFKLTSKKTKKEKYNDENYNNREKAIETNLIKYGVTNPSMSLGRNSKTYRIKQYILKNGDKIRYQSKPELNFILECEENNIPILNGDTIIYTINNKNRRYYVDFKIFFDGKYQLIEIKGKNPYYFEAVKDGTLEAKIKAAKKHSKLNKYHPFKIIYT